MTLVETQRVAVADRDDPLHLHGGGRLDHVEVAFETYGTLAPARDNVVLVCHALTGDAHAAGRHDGAARPGWWHTMIGPGKAVDTDRFFVVSPNLLGGCAGTTGPQTVDPVTGSAYALDFPALAMTDLVAVHRRLLDALGIGRLHAGIGGSLGGMQVLQWVLDEPDRLDRAVLIAASSRLTAENIAFSSVGREAILGDPDFHDGRYREHGTLPRRGLKVARMMAHITYVSPLSLEQRFGRERGTSGEAQVMTPDFAVEKYLQHQGETFPDRFDALTYLYLSRLLDYFDPFEDPRAGAALQATRTRFLLLSFDSDWRFSTPHSRRILEHLRAAGVDADFEELSSPYGHDSFLLEPPGYHDRIAAFLR